MKRIILCNDRQAAYHFLKKDFQSAYKNNGHNVELALEQVAHLRDVQTSYVRSILFTYIKSLIK